MKIEKAQKKSIPKERNCKNKRVDFIQEFIEPICES